DLCLSSAAPNGGLIANFQNPNDPNATTPDTAVGNGTQVCTGPNDAGVDPYQVLVIGYPAQPAVTAACPAGYTATNGSAQRDITSQLGVVNAPAPGRITLAILDNGAGVGYPGVKLTGGTLQGHPSATGAMAVGAASWDLTEPCGTSPTQLEGYSAK